MSEPIIEYRDEFNVMDIASKYAERISRVIDEQTLANVEHQLAMYGYVKVVRCRDCVYFDKYENDEINVCYRFDNEQPIIKPDGFCAWAERRQP